MVCFLGYLSAQCHSDLNDHDINIRVLLSPA